MARIKGKTRAKINRKKRLKSKNSYYLKRKSLLSRIRKWNDPILKRVCDIVSPDEDVSEIVKELKSVLKVTDNGLGLAASQIGYVKRIFVMRASIKGDIKVVINSNIVEESEEKEVREEGCLSFPGFYTKIERSSTLTILYEDELRSSHKVKFKGVEAMVASHEHDHNFGICLVGEDYRKSLEEKD